jgi:hypothetical protein
MPAGHQPIGERLYLFSSNAGQRTTAECTIDAHGEQTLISGEFALPANVTVRFYVEQGAALAAHLGRRNIGTPTEYAYSNSLEAIATGAATEDEHFTGPGNCPNYNLRKIQKSNTGILGGQWSNYVR